MSDGLSGTALRTDCGNWSISFTPPPEAIDMATDTESEGSDLNWIILNTGCLIVAVCGLAIVVAVTVKIVMWAFS